MPVQSYEKHKTTSLGAHSLRLALPPHSTFTAMPTLYQTIPLRTLSTYIYICNQFVLPSRLHRIIAPWTSRPNPHIIIPRHTTASISVTPPLYHYYICIPKYWTKEWKKKKNTESNIFYEKWFIDINGFYETKKKPPHSSKFLKTECADAFHGYKCGFSVTMPRTDGHSESKMLYNYDKTTILKIFKNIVVFSSLTIVDTGAGIKFCRN